MAVGDIILGSTGGARALPRQNLEIIAVIRRWRPGGVWAIAFGLSISDQRTQRALLPGILGLPIEPVMFVGGTAELLRVLAPTIAYRFIAAYSRRASTYA